MIKWPTSGRRRSKSPQSHGMAAARRPRKRLGAARLARRDARHGRGVGATDDRSRRAAARGPPTPSVRRSTDKSVGGPSGPRRPVSAICAGRARCAICAVLRPTAASAAMSARGEAAPAARRRRTPPAGAELTFARS